MQMNPCPLITATLEQIIAYVRYALEKQSACVFILGLLFLLLVLPLAMVADVALLPARISNGGGKILRFRPAQHRRGSPRL
jgi:hypothetical protein